MALLRVYMVPHEFTIKSLPPNTRVSLYTHTSYTILYIVGWVIFNFFANFDMRYKVQENYFQKLIDFGPKRHSRETFNVRIFKNRRGPQK